MHRPASTYVTIAFGCALGVAAEWALDRFSDPVEWIPDLVVGLSFFAAGAFVARDERTRRTAALLILAGVTWFLPNFADSSASALAQVAAHTAMLHRAVIVHAIVALPVGRLRTTRNRVLVSIGYAIALLAPTRSPSWIIAFGLFAAATCWLALGTDDEVRNDTRIIGSAYATALVATGLARSVLGARTSPRAVALLYDAGIVLITLLIARAANGETMRQNHRADALLQISLGPEESVRGALSESFRDPTIRVAYAMPGTAPTRWIDELGRSIPPPSISDGHSRSVMVDDETVAVVTSELHRLDTPDLQRSADAVAAIASRSARLRARLRDDAVALESSRRRLLAADDHARVGFSLELASGASASLLQVTNAVADLMVGDVPDELRAALAAAAEQLEVARSDLSRFAAGLGPADLESRGFEVAVRSLGGVGPIPVQIDVDEDALPHDVALTAYFVCAEAITNAWKHADAAVILVSAHRVGDRLELLIIDDGHGGVRSGNGSGLDSLVDRVTAAGGSIVVKSPLGEGTRLTVELPIRGPDGLSDPGRSQSPTRTHGTPKL